MKGNRLIPLFLTLIIAIGVSAYIKYSPKKPVPSYDYLYPIKNNKKVGFIDDKGNIVIKPQFDLDNYKIITKGTKYIAVRLNSKIGYIDMSGQFVVDPKYDKATNIYENTDYAMVSIDDKYGFVDGNGKEVIPLNFDGASPTFNEGMCAVKSGNKWGFIDTTGNFVIEPQFDAAFNFICDNTMVMKDGLWGLINKKGEFIIDPKFDDIDFSTINYQSIPYEKRAKTPFPVKIDNQWGYIDLSGNILISPKYKFASNISDGLMVVCSASNKWQYLDESSNEILNLTDYKLASIFSEDKAFVLKDDKYGAIDKDGTLVIPNEYEALSNFLEDRAVACKDDKYGYIDSNNNQITDFKFDFADFFINNIAQVTLDLPTGASGEDFRQGKIGYIDKDGKYIWEPSE